MIFFKFNFLFLSSKFSFLKLWLWSHKKLELFFSGCNRIDWICIRNDIDVWRIFPYWCVWQVAKWVLLTAKCDKMSLYSIEKCIFPVPYFCCFFIFSLYCWSIALLDSLWSTNSNYYVLYERICIVLDDHDFPIYSDEQQMHLYQKSIDLNCSVCTYCVRVVHSRPLYQLQRNVESMSHKVQLLTQWVYVPKQCFHYRDRLNKLRLRVINGVYRTETFHRTCVFTINRHSNR